MLTRHGLGVRRDPARAAALLRRSVVLGNPFAAEHLAQMMMEGELSDEEMWQALTAARQAADRGSAPARALMALHLLHGWGIVADPAAAAKLARQAAQAGSALGMRVAAQADPEHARDWLEQGAAAGDPWALYRLARELLASPEAGDRRRGLELLTRAGHAGWYAALRDLALVHEQGLYGAPADPERARYWRGLADERGG